MDKTLKTLHLRLDSTSKSLTKNAISQLIIKVLFQHEKPLKILQIETDLEKILKTKIETNRVLEGLEKLIEKKEINFEKDSYELTRPNRRELEKRYSESKNRLNRIIEKYFSPFHSDKDVVIEWFSDATVEFFKSYSIEWISDLCYTKSEKLKTKKENIFKHIERRTQHNTELDKEDKTNLIESFVECIVHKKDSDLDALLWEYGTSAFAANLLQSSIGADPISINAFRDSKCVLDTNVLMNIGLEASEYHYAIKKLDTIFNELNINTGYFHITEQEYIKTVANKKKDILKTASKFAFEVIKETDDHFIQSAIKRKCRLYEDFETFTEQISLPPKRLDEKKEINLFNNDENLDIEIQNAQNDAKKKEHLNSLFKDVTGNNKKEAPLLHDVGLIAGIEYYRKTEKAFVLSQEISINKYSHTKPIKDNLPIAIKLETLINMLAIDNGGTDVNPTDFSNLFADMIRFNLQPDKNTFEIADLSKLLETELQIEQLPSEEVIKIANNLHKNRIKGLPEDEISLALNREFQDVKLKFVADLDVAYESLSYEKREKEIKTNQLSKTEKALRDIIYAEELKKFDNRVFKNQLIWYGAIPLCITILTCIGIYYFNNDNQTDYMNFVISIIINIVFWVFTSLIIITPKLRKKSLYEKNLIEKIVETRFENEVN
ncbi:hypothetical protein [Flavobacterium proteolyticum]|uniref:Uncharacterized protein n=1 Tax=Flavobacterium proteolyticum TaxID=2911683 RepID=A0ABR9WTS5_9FLAO|nr:hypothetical protein [Flavobacterium proteolyticum]MBE9577043.1 hypothetical protein [Flavobacterium proteolyticum]